MLCFCKLCYCHATLCVFNLYHFHHYFQGVLSARCGLFVILSLCLRVRPVSVAGLYFFCTALFVSDATPSDSHCCGLYSMLCHAMLRYAPRYVMQAYASQSGLKWCGTVRLACSAVVSNALLL